MIKRHSSCPLGLPLLLRIIFTLCRTTQRLRCKWSGTLGYVLRRYLATWVLILASHGFGHSEDGQTMFLPRGHPSQARANQRASGNELISRVTCDSATSCCCSIFCPASRESLLLKKQRLPSHSSIHISSLCPLFPAQSTRILSTMSVPAFSDIAKAANDVGAVSPDLKRASSRARAPISVP